MKVNWQPWMEYLDGWKGLKPGAPEWAQREWESYQADRADYKGLRPEDCEDSPKEPQKED